jgi:hypothetical protein
MTTERSGSFIQSAGSAPAVSSMDVTALYDLRDGRVIHMHYVITLEGAERRTREEQQQSARESALRLGCNVEGLAVLHVVDFQPTDKTYRVDLQTRALVEMPVTPRKPVIPRKDRRLPSAGLARGCRYQGH